MSVAHTAGPWTVDKRSATAAHGYGHRARPPAFYILGPRGRAHLIASMAVTANGDNVSQAAADAMLIAAVPDLLAALQKATAFLLDNYKESDMPDILPACCAALAKVVAS